MWKQPFLVELRIYFQDVSDQVESCSIPTTDHPLELCARVVVRGDWRAHVCAAVAGDLRARRTYRGDRAQHLIRAIRNKVTTKSCKIQGADHKLLLP